MSLLDNQELKGGNGENKDTAEKQNDFFASVFTSEDVDKIPTPALPFPANKDETLSEAKGTEEVVLQQIDISKCNKSLGPDGIYGTSVYSSTEQPQ